MPIRYGVLKGKAVDRRPGTAENPHYQIHVEADGTDYRVAVNVKSQSRPYDLLYYADERFEHEITQGLAELPFGFTKLESRPGGIALDFIRSNLFDPRAMAPPPFDRPGQDNDLNEKMDFYLNKAMAAGDAEIYAFGEGWGPEDVPDKVFGFRPGRGIHDIHMNQGNEGKFRKDDGVYQDGAPLLHFPSEARWIAVFLAFQSQSWHTDDATGHTIGGTPSERPDQPDTPSEPHQPVPPAASADEPVYVAAALVRPADGTVASKETVSLLNAGDKPVDLSGWSLANKSKQKYRLSGTIGPGQFMTVALERGANGQEFLSNKGDIITLLNASGLKVHGVSYTRSQVKAGWTIPF
ncbi:DUF2278 family protein [Paenibacillus sp. P25]|nr:DUF2278 family protein [Paenibacillus sp. P25]